MRVSDSYHLFYFQGYDPSHVYLQFLCQLKQKWYCGMTISTLKWNKNVTTSSGLGVYGSDGCKFTSLMVIIIAANVNNIFASECLAIDQGKP